MTALNQTFIHYRQYRRTRILSIFSSKTMNPVLQVMNQILKSKIQMYVSQLPISDICMDLAPHLCMQKHVNFSPLHINHAHLGSSQTTHEDIFPEPSQLQKLNQFKPVLASGKILKNLKFPTFCTNLTHFYYKFLKDFYIFRILGPSGSLWYQWIQDSSSIS